jgi:alpha-D-ribose 1-methylphosphonate 5-triphosphate synthase subunit PhnG
VTSHTLPTEAAGDDIADRQRWMRTLAAADPDTLAAAWQGWQGWQPKPAV